ncbi:atrial natriuretic peptide receptor 3-like [Gigantopelta aegis]|uniref:atrial natriuretic peptide receptor 3-like n=1 Tax=Gigantopelta aegis TaxID=1735272 RepID=UPI001B888B7B|nr:atrial natriuretic peptide receptor 3-like [Gigantopelta aegis]
MISSITLLGFVCVLLGMTSSLEIKIAVILPFDDARLFGDRKIAPAIEVARDRLKEDQILLNSTTIVVHYEDSQCDIAHGINKAIKLYMDHEVHVFLGPVCDFAVAPVARQSRFWNLPVVSGGAMAREFALFKNTTYSHLTRVGPVNFHSLSKLIELIFIHFKWKRLKLLYEGTGQDKYVTGFCHLATEAVHYNLLDKGAPIQQDYFRLDGIKDYAEMLSKEVAQDYASRW